MTLSHRDLSGTQLGHFRLVKRVGSGGMADVYKAHEESLNRIVALKILSHRLSEEDEFIQRFSREAKAAAQLNHPNIVQIYSIGEQDGIHYFAMEFVEGETLSGAIKRLGPFAEDKALSIVQQVCLALSAAHRVGLVHRDIKPSNIMLGGDGSVKVTDFGIARVGDAQTKLTREGSIIGTPEYLAPEQCEGKVADARSDLYSLGVTLFEMLGGRTPFEADTPVGLIMKVMKGEGVSLQTLRPELSPEMADLVSKLMAHNPEERFESASEAAAAIRDILADKPAGTPTTLIHPAVVSDEEPVRELEEPLPRPPSRWKAWVGTVAFLALLVAGLWWYRQAHPALGESRQEGDAQAQAEKAPPIAASIQADTDLAAAGTGSDSGNPSGEAPDQPSGDLTPTEGAAGEPAGVVAAPEAGAVGGTVPVALSEQSVPGPAGAGDERKESSSSGQKKALPVVNPNPGVGSGMEASPVTEGKQRVAVEPHSAAMTFEGEGAALSVVESHAGSWLTGNGWTLHDPGAPVAAVWRFRLDHLGTETLQYYGNSTEQQTVFLTVSLCEPGSGRIIKKSSTKVSFTMINIEEELGVAVQEQMDNLAAAAEGIGAK